MSMFRRLTTPSPSMQWDGAEQEYPGIVAEGSEAWRRWGADGEVACDYRGGKRVAWLIGFYNARTRNRVRCMAET